MNYVWIELPAKPKPLGRRVLQFSIRDENQLVITVHEHGGKIYHCHSALADWPTHKIERGTWFLVQRN